MQLLPIDLLAKSSYINFNIDSYYASTKLFSNVQLVFGSYFDFEFVPQQAPIFDDKEYIIT